MTFTSQNKNICELNAEEKEKLNKTQSVLNNNKLESSEKYKQIVAIISSKNYNNKQNEIPMVTEEYTSIITTQNKLPSNYKEIKLNCFQQKQLNQYNHYD